ncbi:hypothetical protein C1H46_009648 [Malus baccata]|uniref:Uncharacterized protein n=1 Tax=Malus baccata TaxID=106549 RepID=A0A540N1A0_MALBA|nr:hypothetical protein C1H46_009648 [Malus baccata]
MDTHYDRYFLSVCSSLIELLLPSFFLDGQIFVLCGGRVGQKFLRRRGPWCETIWRLSTGEVNSLKEEVTTLRGQVAAQGDHIRAQDERMNMIVQALAMSGLQIPTMPAPNVAPPSISQPFCPDDTE